MNTKDKQQRPELPAETSVNFTDDSFDFELWAKTVRRQLLAALQKRGRQSSN